MTHTIHKQTAPPAWPSR